MKPKKNKEQKSIVDKSYLIVMIITLLAISLLVYHNQTQNGTQNKNQETDLQEKNIAENNIETDKKQLFFNLLRPLIRQENMKIQYHRSFLQNIKDDFTDSPHHNRATIKKLKRLSKVYGVKDRNIQDALTELKLRVDIIPESLVLGQAAIESAWGTSRFAKEANNLFGEWCFTKGCGLVPKKRNVNSKHEIKSFPTKKESLISYMRNLNSHSAYKELRQMRADIRANKKALTGVKLAEGLIRYSEKREAYVKTLIKVIKQNKLE